MHLMLCLALCAAEAGESGRGPRPGEVYREYATHNGGNAWRVTDPAAKAQGAQQFLPNPVLTVQVDDLVGAMRAEALLDRWGGHLRTTDKRIRFNGREWIRVPELRTTPPGHRPEMYYAQDNPIVEVPLDHLREGANTFEGTCGALGEYNWGQWGLYSLILRVYYDPQQKPHPVGRIVDPPSGASCGENPLVAVEPVSPSAVVRIDVLAWYEGYDENGDGVYADWHGGNFQPTRGAVAALAGHVGSIYQSPYQLTWNTRWIPDQQPGSIRLVARICDNRGVWWVTDAVENLSLARANSSVRLFRPSDVPERFGVRVSRTAGCTIPIAVPDGVSRANEAGLALRTWHGWDGHHEPLQINEHMMKIAGKNHHYDYDILPVPVTALRDKSNRFRIHSKTPHHMLEVLWPGPALLVRYGQPWQEVPQGR